jgi:signal peptidase I
VAAKVRFRRLIIGALVGVALGLEVSIILLPWALPGRVRVVGGYSMSPTFRPGDAIVVEKVATSDVKPGDLITFYDPANHLNIAHRVVRVRQGPRFVTRGDGNLQVDPNLVRPEYIDGRVTMLAPRLGFLLVLGRAAGPLLLLGFGATLLRRAYRRRKAIALAEKTGAEAGAE